MKMDQLVFVGLNGYALALNRDTGEIVWSNDKLESGPVTLLLDGDRLIASTGGYIFCLDPLTGEVKWNNPLKGYGLAAPAALVSVRGQSPHALASQHQAAADAASTATTTAVVAAVVATS
jgi:outer membrane protein assembly factor BamB